MDQPALSGIGRLLGSQMLRHPSTQGKMPPSVRSGEDVIRGSANVPLSPQGLAQADEIGHQIRQHGGVDSIASSDLERARETARLVQRHNPQAQITDVTPALHPWHLGMLEGQPTRGVLHHIEHYVKNPAQPVPGRGPASTQPGESFDSFRSRFLPYLNNEMGKAAANPAKKHVLVTHYRNIKLAESWLKRGGKPDGAYDPNEMMQKDGEPGDLYHVDPQRKTMQRLNLKQPGQLPGGLFILRHGYTRLNAENPTGAGKEA
jgi:broad specificity phosphatase PhoE